MKARYVMGAGAVAAAISLVGPPAPAMRPDAPVAPELIPSTQKYLREHPEDARAWATLGTAYVERARRTGDPVYYPKARGALKRSLRLRPDDNPDALIAMGTLANAEHDFRRGLAWGTRARRADPWRSAAYGVLTDALVELGRYRAARKPLRRMLDLRPDVASFTRAAHLMELRGRKKGADHALRRAVTAAAAPHDVAYCRFRLGEMRWEAGDPAGALREYERALAADAGSALALAGRARALAALGRTEEAVAGYVAGIARTPLPRFARELGELQQSLGRADAADRQYAVAAGQGDVLTLADHGDPRAAVRLARKEWQRRRSIDVADALGWALHRAGRTDRALRYARAAARLGGRNALHDYHRGEIERALGQDRAARAHLTRSLETNPHFSPLWAARARRALASL